MSAEESKEGINQRKYKYRDLGIYEKYQGPWAIAWITLPGIFEKRVWIKHPSSVYVYVCVCVYRWWSSFRQETLFSNGSHRDCTHIHRIWNMDSFLKKNFYNWSNKQFCLKLTCIARRSSVPTLLLRAKHLLYNLTSSNRYCDDQEFSRVSSKFLSMIFLRISYPYWMSWRFFMKDDTTSLYRFHRQ